MILDRLITCRKAKIAGCPTHLGILPHLTFPEGSNLFQNLKTISQLPCQPTTEMEQKMVLFLGRLLKGLIYTPVDLF